MPTKRQAGKPTVIEHRSIADAVVKHMEHIESGKREAARLAKDEAERGFEIERPILYVSGLVDGAKQQRKNSSRHAAAADRGDPLTQAIRAQLEKQRGGRPLTAASILDILVARNLVQIDLLRGNYHWHNEADLIPAFSDHAFAGRVSRARDKIKKRPPS